MLRGSAKYILDTGRTNLTCAEIGVRSGENAVEMLKSMSITNLFLVDDYSPYQDGDEFITDEMQQEFYSVMLKALSPYDNVTIKKQSSISAAAEIAGPLFDVVYIDARHEKNDVVIDCTTWWSKIKPGGYLTGHDFWFPGVFSAVHEFFVSHATILIVFNDSDWLIQKPTL